MALKYSWAEVITRFSKYASTSNVSLFVGVFLFFSLVETEEMLRVNFFTLVRFCLLGVPRSFSLSLLLGESKELLLPLRLSTTSSSDDEVSLIVGARDALLVLTGILL